MESAASVLILSNNRKRNSSYSENNGLDRHATLRSLHRRIGGCSMTKDSFLYHFVQSMDAAQWGGESRPSMAMAFLRGMVDTQRAQRSMCVCVCRPFTCAVLIGVQNPEDQQKMMLNVESKANQQRANQLRDIIQGIKDMQANVQTKIDNQVRALNTKECNRREFYEGIGKQSPINDAYLRDIMPRSEALVSAHKGPWYDP